MCSFCRNKTKTSTWHVLINKINEKKTAVQWKHFMYLYLTYKVFINFISVGNCTSCADVLQIHTFVCMCQFSNAKWCYAVRRISFTWIFFLILCIRFIKKSYRSISNRNDSELSTNKQYWTEASIVESNYLSFMSLLLVQLTHMWFDCWTRNEWKIFEWIYPTENLCLNFSRIMPNYYLRMTAVEAAHRPKSPTMYTA